SLRGRVRAVDDHGPKKLIAPMPGKIVRVLVSQGAEVEAGTGVLVVEAMKMQNEIKSPETCWRSWNSQHIKSLLLRPVAVEHLLGVEIFDLGGVPQNFVICSLQQLLAAIVKLRTDGLLDSRIAKLALSRRFLRHQFYDAISHRLPGRRIHHGDDGAVLAGLELHDRVPRCWVGSFQA